MPARTKGPVRLSPHLKNFNGSVIGMAYPGDLLNRTSIPGDSCIAQGDISQPIGYVSYCYTPCSSGIDICAIYRQRIYLAGPEILTADNTLLHSPACSSSVRVLNLRYS